jgi:hypothetical protein
MMRYAILAVVLGPFFPVLDYFLYLLGLSFQPEEAPGFWNFISGFLWIIVGDSSFLLWSPFYFSVGPFSLQCGLVPGLNLYGVLHSIDSIVNV